MEACFESAKLLLEHRCPIYDAAKIVTACFKNDEFEGGSRWITLFMPQLVNRRVQLKTLALAHLPPQESIVPFLREPRVLDALALETYKCSRKRGLNVPEALRIGEASTIYSWVRTRRQAETLWAYGFRDLESVFTCTNLRSRWNILDTALLYDDRSRLWSSLELAEWAMQHGAVAGDDDGSPKMQRLLELAWKFGARIAEDGDEGVYITQVSLGDCSRMLLPFLRQIFDLGVRDGCQCHCTAQGCDGTALAVRSFLRESRWWLRLGSRATQRVKCLSRLSRRFHELVTFLLGVFEVDSEAFELVTEDLVRCLAFELTEQKHTCCTRNRRGKQELPYLEQELINEMHEEHREELEQFEDLVARLTSDFDTRSPDEKEFMDFVHGTFRRRIGEWFFPGTNENDNDDSRAGYVKALQDLNIRVNQRPRRELKELWHIVFGSPMKIS